MIHKIFKSVFYYKGAKRNAEPLICLLFLFPILLFLSPKNDGRNRGCCFLCGLPDFLFTAGQKPGELRPVYDLFSDDLQLVFRSFIDYSKARAILYLQGGTLNRLLASFSCFLFFFSYLLFSTPFSLQKATAAVAAVAFFVLRQVLGSCAASSTPDRGRFSVCILPPWLPLRKR